MSSTAVNPNPTTVSAPSPRPNYAVADSFLKNPAAPIATHIYNPTTKAIEPTGASPDFSAISGHVQHSEADPTHTIGQRIKDAFTMDGEKYDQKYAGDDKAISDKVDSVLGHIIPFYSDNQKLQHIVDQTKAGKQVSQFIKDQTSHPEQIAMGGVEGPEGEISGELESAAKEGESGFALRSGTHCFSQPVPTLKNKLTKASN